MRALADFIMRGRVQATLVVVVSAVLPLLFWLSAAAGSLVLLRRGFKDASTVIAFGLLPAVAIWAFGDPSTLLVLLGTLGLAALLRAGHSWSRVLLSSVVLGLVYSLILDSVLRETFEVLAKALSEALPQVEGKPVIPGELIGPVLVASTAVMLQLFSVLALMLARYWQAALYNPGGFGREFRALKLPRAVMLALVAAMVLGPFIGPQFIVLASASSLVLVLAGIALMHGLVAQGRLAGFWLVGMSVTLPLIMQLIYPLLVVLAIVDSLIDFRGRKSPEGNDSANGEG
ncbi:membrane protein [Pseudomonas putida]|nr:membrane protein [Pseudomonas putida]